MLAVLCWPSCWLLAMLAHLALLAMLALLALHWCLTIAEHQIACRLAERAFRPTLPLRGRAMHERRLARGRALKGKLAKLAKRTKLTSVADRQLFVLWNGRRNRILRRLARRRRRRRRDDGVCAGHADLIVLLPDWPDWPEHCVGIAAHIVLPIVLAMLLGLEPTHTRAQWCELAPSTVGGCSCQPRLCDIWRLRLTMLARIVLLAELDIHIGLTRLARILFLHLLLADIHLVLDVLAKDACGGRLTKLAW